ncbi:transposase [Marimonas sp. MJW-29]|uniref:Transposase n=1 Tax=Sulfitobacter sediminis TaxID=3234186 RepID=A0ABV3RQ66_9RHOB
MTAYRRLRVPGATYFFTVTLADRNSGILIDRISELRRAFRLTMDERPFVCDAAVILPDHLHTIWTLPEGDADFSTRWRLIKSRFSRASGIRSPIGASQCAKQERGVWQRRFWEHCIRDETDFVAHLSYCWGNPVKHGYVSSPMAWPFSSIHRDRLNGRVPMEWIGEPEGDFGEP